MSIKIKNNHIRREFGPVSRRALIGLSVLSLVFLGLFLLTRTAPAVTLFSTQEPVTQAEKITQEVLADDPGAMAVEKTESSIKFRLSDGQYRLISIIGKLYTQDGIEIDPTLKDTSSKWWEAWKWGEDDWLAQTGEGLDYAIRIGEAGNRQFIPRKSHPGEYIELGSPEYYDGTSWLSLPLSEVQIEDNHISWAGDAYTLEYIITPTGSKSNLILNNPSANHPLRWPIELYNLTQDNQHIYSDSQEDPVAVLQEPYWTDANQKTGEVTWEIQPRYIQFTPQITEGAVYPVTVDPDFGTSIVTGADDGYYSAYQGAVNTSATNIFNGESGGDGNGWYRFTNITIPKWATVSVAHLDLVSETSNGGTLNTRIYGVNQDNDVAAPTDVTTWTADHNIHTSAYAAWTSTIITSPGVAIETSDFSSVVQEIVGRGGWSSGNAFSIHIDDNGGGAQCYQLVASYENSSYAEPSIDITYAAGSPPAGVTIWQTATSGGNGSMNNVHAVTLPTGQTEGNTLIGMVYSRNASYTLSHTWGTGWNEIADYSHTTGTYGTLTVAWSKVDSTPDSSVNVTVGSGYTAYWSAIVYEVGGAADPTSLPPVISAKATGTTLTPDPPSFTPSYGSQDYLWIAMYGNRYTYAPTGWPTNYTISQTSKAGSTSAGSYTSVGTAGRQYTGATENPGNFTVGTSAYWVAATVAVHPAALPGVTVSKSSAAVTEGGATDTYTVKLDSAPDYDVSIAIGGGGGEAGGLPTPLTFTSGNWSAPQTVTVTAVNDDIDEDATEIVSLTHAASSTDTDYNGISINSVSVTVTDNDTAGVILSET